MRAWDNSSPQMAQWIAPYSRGGVRKFAATSRTTGTVICCHGRCAASTRGSRSGIRKRDLVFIRPPIRAERSGGKARRIVKVAAFGVIVPGVTHRGRRDDSGAGNRHRIALDLGFGGHELSVGAGDGEPLQRPVFAP